MYYYKKVQISCLSLDIGIGKYGDDLKDLLLKWLLRGYILKIYRKGEEIFDGTESLGHLEHDVKHYQLSQLRGDTMELLDLDGNPTGLHGSIRERRYW